MAEPCFDEQVQSGALALLSAWLKAAPGDRALMIVANSEGELRLVAMYGGDPGRAHTTVRSTVVLEPTLSDCVVRAAGVLT